MIEILPPIYWCEICQSRHCECKNRKPIFESGDGGESTENDRIDIYIDKNAPDKLTIPLPVSGKVPIFVHKPTGNITLGTIKFYGVL